jgi:hypothetical protein
MEESESRIAQVTLLCKPVSKDLSARPSSLQKRHHHRRSRHPRRLVRHFAGGQETYSLRNQTGQ